MIGFPANIIDVVAESHARAKEQACELKTKAEDANRMERVWQSVHTFTSRGWAFHLLSFLSKETPMLKRLREENHPAIPALEEAYRIAEDEAKRSMRDYPALLQEACSLAALPLDGSSRHPRYTLNGGFFKLDIDESKRVARLSDHEGRLAELSADVDPVIEIIQREYNRIFGRPFDGKKFLKQLRSHYLAVLKRDHKPDGEAVPVRQITRRLGKNMKDFRADEFLVDLSRLVECGPLDIDGRRLDLQQTKDTNQGMLLYGASARGYVGFVTFREV